MKKYASGGMSQSDRYRALEKAEREDSRMPSEANKDTQAEFDRRVSAGEDYSVKTLMEAKQAAEAPYRIKNMREDARKSTSDILRRPIGMKKGGSVKSSASKRADGIAQRGKTRGRMV